MQGGSPICPPWTTANFCLGERQDVASVANDLCYVTAVLTPTTQGMRLAKAAKIVEAEINETLSYYSMLSKHWRSIKTNNPLERLMREIRRRTRVVGAFADGHSALMLVAARLRHGAATKWDTRRYLQMKRLSEVVALS